jgi:hypothetical protein
VNPESGPSAGLVNVPLEKSEYKQEYKQVIDTAKSNGCTTGG